MRYQPALHNQITIKFFNPSLSRLQTLKRKSRFNASLLRRHLYVLNPLIKWFIIAEINIFLSNIS